MPILSYRGYSCCCGVIVESPSIEKRADLRLQLCLNVVVVIVGLHRPLLAPKGLEEILEGRNSKVHGSCAMRVLWLMLVDASKGLLTTSCTGSRFADNSLYSRVLQRPLASLMCSCWKGQAKQVRTGRW
jgi:hypothetical protein